MVDRGPDAGFGLYLHWPYCAAKCPYCDFNSHVAASIDQTRWQDAYLLEIRRIAAETPSRILRSVFFGGGTPSLMDASLVDAILREVRACWQMANDIEITLEANPSSVEAKRFAGYRAAGVNRVSLGIQALDNDDLRRLGRLHTVEEAHAALDIAKAEFDRVSFDLIYARQHQSLAGWKTELSQALELATGHLSLYQLTIEDGTAFGDRHARGRLPGLPDDDLGADMFDVTQEMCNAAGLPAYEISNHAGPDQASRHNLIYWRGGDYAGIGPGAHGRLTLGGTRYATSTPLGPAAWLKQVEETGSGESPRDVISMDDQATERVLMGLRLTDGVELSSSQVDKLSNNINELRVSGFLGLDGQRLYLTDKGRPLLNAILRELLA
ncbi:MAG: radical SAM family heme chaperone HemW [Alphaproteobacteria bacterium]|nr:radical SAM family heme chaperone HemW [Alphaproteobacteria bacterium]